MKKTLFYISTVRFPNARAHSIQIMKMCEAFSEHFDVMLFAGGKKRADEDIFSFYSAKPVFPIRVLGPVWRGRRKYFSDIVSAFHARRVINKEKPDIVFIREPLVAFILSFFDIPFYYENHTLAGKNKLFLKRITRRAKGIISTNQYKKDWIVGAWGVPADKILVAFNGVDASFFEDIPETKSELRAAFQLPQDKVLVGHIGRLSNKGIDKGADFIIESVAGMDLSSTMFCFVGCTEEEQKKHEALTRAQGIESRFLWRGHVPHQMVLKYLKAMDYLLLLQSPDNEAAVLYASALKAFEYMASGVPIIAVRLPAIEEVCDDSVAALYRPRDQKDCRATFEYALGHPDEMRIRADRAKKKAMQYDWSSRVARISTFMLEHE